VISSRPATEKDSIVGVMPKFVCLPDTVDDAASRIAESERSGESLAFIGGGTDIEIGSPPDRLDVVVRTERLDRVIEHAPSDQIITVEAGLTLTRLQSVVSAHGQRLALDPPLADRATIGGIIAANAFGPLRTRYGSVRDLIIGVSIIRADGVIARGGGKVVKNVAGFDLPKLMVGSLGTLGMIATATFRLHPLPEVSETLLIRNQSASDLRNLMAEMTRMQLEAAAIAAIAAGPRFDIAIRFEGFHNGVVEQGERLLRVGTGFSRSGPAESFWRRHDEIRAAGPVRLKIATLPSAIDVVAPLVGLLTGGGFVWYPTLGLGFLTGATTADQEVAAAIRTARRTLALTIEAAPLAVRQLSNSWGEPGAAVPLMRAMKLRFDPARRLSPGRFVGGI
jgi:glycolate oxidase FAD binding subunit